MSKKIVECEEECKILGNRLRAKSERLRAISLLQVEIVEQAISCMIASHLPCERGVKTN